MSSVFTVRRRESGREEAVVGRLLTAAVILLACGLALYVAVRFLVLPVLTIRHVVVEGDVPVTDRDVLTLAGLQGTAYYPTVQTAAIERRLEGLPLVHRAVVEKRFPDTLRIVLHRRQAVGLLIAESGGRSVPLLVDRDGVAFKLGATGAEVDLPVVSGITLGAAAPGTALPAGLLPLFADLAALREKSPSLFRLISEVRIVPQWSGSSGAAAATPAAGALPPAGAGVTSSAADRRDASPGAVHELLLFLVSSPVRIRAGGSVDETLLRSALMVIDLLSNQGVSKDIGELDFRGSDVVYRMKEG
jgi:cell division protein FtsQ